MAFSDAPAYLSAGTEGSRSDHLLEPVLEAIRQLGGFLAGDSHAEILEQLRPLVPPASGRALSSALWKLVVEKKSLAYTKEQAQFRDPMPRMRMYRAV